MYTLNKIMASLSLRQNHSLMIDNHMDCQHSRMVFWGLSMCILELNHFLKSFLCQVFNKLSIYKKKKSRRKRDVRMYFEVSNETNNNTYSLVHTAQAARPNLTTPMVETSQSFLCRRYPDVPTAPIIPPYFVIFHSLLNTIITVKMNDQYKLAGYFSHSKGLVPSKTSQYSTISFIW